MSKKLCDVCDIKCHCKTYNKKQLQNGERIVTREVTGKKKDGTPILSKIVRWVMGVKTNDKLIEQLEQKHNFTRRTKLCKHCRAVFGIS